MITNQPTIVWANSACFISRALATITIVMLNYIGQLSIRVPYIILDLDYNQAINNTAETFPHCLCISILYDSTSRLQWIKPMLMVTLAR